MTMRIRISVLVVTLAAVTACGGGGGGGGGEKDPPERLGVQLKEFTVVLGKTSVAAGRIRFAAGNVGAVQHMLVVLRTDLAPEALPLKGTVVDTTGPGVTLVGEIPPIDAGKTERKVFEPTAGKHVLICNVPSHYQQGMRAPLTIT
jgi:uncharacterized cupredoxin-like copper-binding protein